ncbi:3-oxoacyl-ACP reductase FabG [Candidatus Atribacteria bacterium MT.SAG.1]|nr:3-oxoacyl-ACP reductase FabG [Candidatus Atribacteria bacterium MT.SAG.1]
MELKGKVALVTGGSRGIGKAIAIALARAAADIALTYKEQKEAAEQVVSEIKGLGGKAIALQMEVKDRNSVRKAICKAVEYYKKIDILVNNAGINKPTDFDKITDSDWDEILNVNLKGPFICSQEVLPIMRKQQTGCIINISSVSGQYGGPRTAHYAVSKAGLISLGQVIARFGGKYNIRCNTIAAGLITSEMAAKGMNSEVVKRAAANIPMGRLGTTDEVAKAVVFLASDDSSYITAQTINVNGGLYF